MATSLPVDGFLEVATLLEEAGPPSSLLRRGRQVVPLPITRRLPSGRVEEQVFENFWIEMDSVTRQVVCSQGLLGLFLSLRGYGYGFN
jgi:hypothetical protein